MIRKLGMFSPEIKRDTLMRFFDAVWLYGFEEIQFDFLTVCDQEMPDHIDEAMVAQIREAADHHDVCIRAVNGTFNMIHPDPMEVDWGIVRLEEIAKACKGLGCGIITLCTGSRCVNHMWQPHPDNSTQQAWEDLVTTMRRAVEIAERYDVMLGVEVEASNVINTAERARSLLDIVNSRHLGIILDPANLFLPGNARPENAAEILHHAFALLKDDIILAHAKDIRAGDGVCFTSAGRGIVAFEEFFEMLDSIDYRGPVIAHGIHDEAEFPYSVQFLKTLMKKAI